MSNTVVRVTQLTQTTAVSNTDLFVVVRGVGSYPTTNSVSFSTLRNNLISNVSISVIPSTNATYTLGNATNQWTNLYISNTIFINNTPLTINANGALVVNGVITTTDRLVSNGYTNILYPNGSFVTAGDLAVPTGKSLRIGNASMQSTDGQLQINNDVVPFSNNTINLGSANTRWKEVWVGPGSIFIADANTANPDVELAANNNLFTVVGTAGMQVGEFTLADNTILIANNQRDIIVGTSNATGYWQFNRPMKVVSSSNTALTAFDVTRNGYVTIKTPSIAAGGNGLEIIGSTDGSTQTTGLAGRMLHITGNDGVPSRVENDSFGTGVFSAFIGRSARGTANTPSSTQSGDVISRFAALGWGNTGFLATNVGSGPPINTIDFVATQNYTDTTAGSKIEFYVSPTNARTRTKALSISTDGVTFADNTVQNTAFNSTAAVTKLVVGTGLTQSGNTGNVSINATGVLTVTGTNNQVLVANSGQNITLSLPQNLNTNASVTFGSITVNAITITGSSTTANTLSVTDKQIHLAPNTATSTQIDGGGFTLGNTAAAYTRSFLYDLTNDRWDTGVANLKAMNFVAANVTGNSASFNLNLHVGNAYAGYDFPNATIQADCNNPGYNQVVAKNHSNSTDASTDYVVTNDIGTDSANYLDLGINSSTYTNADYSITGSNDGYLYINGGNLAIGTQTVGKQLVFFVGGTLANNKIGSANTTGWYLDRLTVTNTINGTANSSNYIGTLAAANVVSTTMLSSNLANYVTLAGLSANITTLNANSATYVGNSSGTLSNIVSWISGNSATAYSNATSYADTKAGAAYANATAYAAGIAATAYSNAVANSASDASSKAATAYSNAIATAASDAASKAATAYSNAVATAASDATTKAGTAYTNAVSQATTLAATAYSNAIGTASLDATTKAGTAYANAAALAANATNLTSGIVSTARLGSGTANSTTVLYGNNVWAALPSSAFSNGASYTWSAVQTFQANVSITNILAAGVQGTNGQVLVANSADGMYWANVKTHKTKKVKHKDGTFETDIDAGSLQDTMTFIDGTGIVMSSNAVNETITINAQQNIRDAGTNTAFTVDFSTDEIVLGTMTNTGTITFVNPTVGKKIEVWLKCTTNKAITHGAQANQATGGATSVTPSTSGQMLKFEYLSTTTANSGVYVNVTKAW